MSRPLMLIIIEPLSFPGDFRSQAFPPWHGLAVQREPQGARCSRQTGDCQTAPLGGAGPPTTRRADRGNVSRVPRVVERTWPEAASPSLSFVEIRGSLLRSVSARLPLTVREC